MKVLELQLPEQTASKLQEAAERLSVSPEQLSILSIEEKLRRSRINFVARLSTCCKRTLTSIADFPDALRISSRSHLATFARYCTKWRKLGLKRSWPLESAVAQPEASFGGEDLYTDLASKAAALAHSLIQNHPFVDGNKRVGHAPMEVFLLLNGNELDASVDEQEKIIIEVASGKVSRIELSEWISKHIVRRNDPS